MRHRGWVAIVIAAGAMIASPTIAGAVPIVYVDTLSNGVPVAGVNNQPLGDYDNPVGATYYQFHATAGFSVTVTGNRIDGFYDMAFWIFAGLFAETSYFGTQFTFIDPAFVSAGDDEIFPPLVAGPNGDPQTTFSAPTTGWYTVAVTNFASDADPPNRFTLMAEGIDDAPAAIPEPATLLLLGTGIGGIALRRRRRA